MKAININLPFYNYVKIYKNLKQNVRLKTSELEVLQRKKLKMLLNHAYRNVKFYHDHFNSVGIKPEDIKSLEDLSKIPIITKQQVKTAGDKILSIGVDKNKCIKRTTTGSTGMPLQLYFSKEDSNYGGASYARARTENGFRLLRDRLLIMRSSVKKKGILDRYKSKYIRRVGRISLQIPLNEQLLVLNKVKPDAIWGIPSGLKILANAIKKRESEAVSPRLVFSASEILNQETRNLINSKFNVDLIDVYGAHEAGCIAWECREHSGYHTSMDTVILECIKEGEVVNADERGEVIITNLHSYVTPFIRYRLGDIVVPTYEECSCGRAGHLIKQIEGRSDDLIKLSDGRIVVPFACMGIMKQFSDDIFNYRVIQEKVDEFTIELVGVNEISEDVINQILSEFKKVLGDNIYRFKIVKEIKKERSGKLRSVISRVSN